MVKRGFTAIPRRWFFLAGCLEARTEISEHLNRIYFLMPLTFAVFPFLCSHSSEMMVQLD